MQSDPVYEKMYDDMAKTIGRQTQGERLCKMVQYVYDRAYVFFIYSPMTLYALNKEVDFIPQKFEMMRFKEMPVTDNHRSMKGVDH